VEEGTRCRPASGSTVGNLPGILPTSSQVQVADAFVPFTEGALGEFRNYRRKAKELADSELAQQQSFSFTIGAADLPPLSRELQTRLEAALISYRKLDVLNDSGSLSKVLKLVERSAHDRGTNEAQRVLAGISRIHQARKMIHARSSWFTYYIESGSREVSAAETLQLFVSYLFHGDKSKNVAAFEASGGWSNPALGMQLISTVGDMLPLLRDMDRLLADILDCTPLHPR
jgi:hypothetical protein